MRSLRKISLPFLATFIGVTIFLSACKKDNPAPYYPNGSSGLSYLFEQLKPTTQTFTVTAGQLQNIQGAKGTKITFPAGAFIRSNGQVVTSGSVTITLQEMLTAGQMILANKTTTSNGSLLQSGGQILLKASLNGEELFVNPTARPIIQIPTNNPVPMNVFYGTCSQDTSVATDTTINWNPADSVTTGTFDTTTYTNTTTVTVTQDSTVGGTTYYTFPTDSFNWINCDHFYNCNCTLGNVTVLTSSDFTASNTQVFIIFPSINSVAGTWGYGNTFSYGGGAPVGMAVKAVVVSYVNGQYYYAIVDGGAIPAGGLTLNVTPQVATVTQINAAITGL